MVIRLALKLRHTEVARLVVVDGECWYFCCSITFMFSFTAQEHQIKSHSWPFLVLDFWGAFVRALLSLCHDAMGAPCCKREVHQIVHSDFFIIRSRRGFSSFNWKGSSIRRISRISGKLLGVHLGELLVCLVLLLDVLVERIHHGVESGIRYSINRLNPSLFPLDLENKEFALPFNRDEVFSLLRPTSLVGEM